MRQGASRAIRVGVLSFILLGSAFGQSLTTTFGGGNGHNGNMFNIVAKQNVVITSFDCNLPPGTHEVRVYRRSGITSYVGFEMNAGAWTNLGTATVTSAGSGLPTPIPVSVNTTLNVGQTRGFYVTIVNANANMNYTAGAVEGAVFAEDGAIQFLEGVGLGWPFGNPTHGGTVGLFRPRVWNGIINYTQPVGVTCVPDAILNVGTCNVIPFGSSSTFSNGYSYLARVPAGLLDKLRPVIEDVAFMPCGSGTWSSNAVRIVMGHLPTPVPDPFTFPVNGLGSFLDLKEIHNGPLAWTANQDQWSHFGFGEQGGTGFVWNGQNDVGFYITYSQSNFNSPSGWNGAVHRTDTEPFRLYAPGHNAATSNASGASGAKMCFRTSPAVCVPDGNSGTGTCNVIPFGSAATFAVGTTYVTRIPRERFNGFYRYLEEISVAPCGDGIWQAPVARVAVGHLPNPLPVPFNFPIGAGTGDFLNLTEIHNGPLSWNAHADQWSPLGICGTSFQWDTQNDVGIYLTFQNANVQGWNGACHRTDTEPFRVYDTTYNAAVSTGSGNNGLKLCLTMSTSPASNFRFQVVNNGLGGGPQQLFSIPAGTTQGWMLISATNFGSPSAGPFFGIWPDGLTWAIVQTFPNPAPGNPLHWSWPVPPPLFPAAALNVPNGTMSPFAGQTWDYVGVALAADFSLRGVTCVERVRW